MAPIATPVSELTRTLVPRGPFAPPTPPHFPPGSPFDPFGPTIPQGPGPSFCEIPTPVPGIVICGPGCECLGAELFTAGGIKGCAAGGCAPIAGEPLGPGGGPLPPGPGAPRPPAPPRGNGCRPGARTTSRIVCPPGCHPNKSDYFLKGGTFVPAGTRCVSNRRRNPLNPRALDRAAGRLRSAQKAVRFLSGVKVPKRRR